MFKKLAVLSAAVAGLSSSAAFAADSKLPFPGTITGNIGVLSSYNLRGITNSPENSSATIQGGLDYAHPSGFYAGYWASTLDYSYACLNPNGCSTSDERNSLESDIYAGYKGKIDDKLSYQIGLTAYYYYPGWESTGYETILGVTYDALTLSAQTMLNNVSSGNKGDTYLLASYSRPLYADFTGRVQLGAYWYGKDDEFVTTTQDFAFRHATLGLTHPLGNSGATMNVDYIFGGYDRMDVKQKNKLVLGLNYSF